MRPLILALALLVGVSAHGQEAPAAPPRPAATDASPAPAASAAATVLKHEVLVVIDSRKRITTTSTWELRIDDPAACAAGLIAPDGLDGASDGDAIVLEDTLLVPPDTPAGTVFTLTAETSSPHAGSHSAAFLGAPDLPTKHARFEIRAPAYEPLHVWHDSRGEPTIQARGTRTMVVQWTDLSPLRPAEAVWSTWEDWLQAGTEIAELVSAKTTNKQGLGREMADGYTGLHLGEAVERVAWAVALEPNGPTDWKLARPATEVLAEGKGSPVDRGVVLLSLLRLAGYDADPGYYRPAGARGAFPITVPAPAMLGRPLIVVHRDDGDVFIDPGAEFVAAPATPAAVIGGITWLPGDLPTPLPLPAGTDGAITINASLAIKGDGSAAWTADLAAEGTAEQWLRELLAPLDETNRSEALKRLIAMGRPELERFGATFSGLEKARARLKITVSGHDEALLHPLGGGLMGEVPSLLAPALAGWLPPNITVRENLAVSVPPSVEIVAAAAPRSGFTDAAILSRTGERRGARLVLVTEVERPYRVSTPALEVSARAFLEDSAAHGPLLLAHAPATRDSMKALRASDLPEVDKLVLEAVLWFRQGIGPRADRSLRFALTAHGGEATAAALDIYGRQEPQLWRYLINTALDNGTGGDRLAILRAAAESRHSRLAWAGAADLAAEESIPLTVRADAYLLMLELQPEDAPDADKNPDAHGRWQEPAALLDAAEALVGSDSTAILLHRASLSAQAADWEAAIALLDRVPDAELTPAAQALHAQALAETGGAVADVLAQLDRALAAAPEDPDVLAAAAAVAAYIGEARRASTLALSAARAQADNPRRWDALVPVAMAAGDLATAGMAARRASDLTPDGARRATTYALTSALLHDADGWAKARARNPKALPQLERFPPDLATMMELAPADGLLAVLQQHDAAVVADPILLGIRAQLRLDAGLLDQAARDGVLLASRHGQPDGVALAFAASSGRMFSTTWRKRLDEAARDSVTARATRMEVGLILGTSDPTADARELAGDPRAAVIERLRTDPAGLASGVEGWPAQAANPSFRAPEGYRTNARLGAVPGVSAVSNPETGTAILHTAPIGATVLPPPLHQLYTAAPQVLTEVAGGSVVRLDGGLLPLFLGRATRETEAGPVTVLTLGFSVEAAGRALLAGSQ